MNDPAPFRLSLSQARRLKVGYAVCAALAALLYACGLAHAFMTGDARHIANASLAGSVLLALLGLGLYMRRSLALSHQRQLNALAWLTDPHTRPEPLDVPELDAEIPGPRPSVDPEPTREDERE